MPSAKFEGDFTQFNAAVNQADANLRQFSTTSDKADSNLRLIKGASTEAYTSIGSLSQGLSAADKTLAAMGVHIGPEIHALDELSQAAGKSAKDIGLIGTASLVAAAALGGWEIGRTIAKFFDLDNTIAHATATWLGYGDVVAETAGAKQDSINLAISRGAATTTTYTQAIQFNHDWVKKHTEAIKEHAKAQEDAADKAKKAAEAEAEALQKLQKAQEDQIHGISDKLFGADDLKKATDYAEAIGRVENVTQLTADGQKELAETMEAGISALIRMGLVTDPLISKFAELEGAANGVSQSVTKIETDEERLKRESDELAKAMKDNFVVIGHSAEEAAQKIVVSFSDALDAVHRGQGTLSGTIQGIAPGAEGSSIRYDDYGNPYGYIPGVNLPGHLTPRAGGGPVSAGVAYMVGERGPELFVPKTSGSIVPGGGSVVINVDARESFFDSPAGVQRLAEKVAGALVSRYQSQGGRL